MKLNGLRLLKIILFLGMAFGCSKNVFKDSAATDSDQSLLVDAKQAVNAFDYQTAIDIITLKMTATGQAQVSTKDVLASAYAGKCGLNFVLYLNSLSHATSGTAFKLMMTPFVGIAADPASCLQSLTTLQAIGTTAQRTSNENAFAAVVGMSLMGSEVRTSVDITPTNGNGTVEGNVCAMTDNQIDFVILGLGNMIQNFSYLTVGQLGSSSQVSINDLITICTSIPGVTSCSITDPTAITAPLRVAIRNLLNTVEYGVGPIVTNGQAAQIATACP
ncbi:MAG: hypothetical protein H7256_03850 [Bdellovibrio sp.]|nr:hypothetical protein [Bdellovibrio sp.]